MSTALLPLAAAVAMDPIEWEGLSVCELDADPATLTRTAGVWLWLLGVAADSPESDRVRDEVLADGALIVALNLPALEFLRWLRMAAWEDFDSTARTLSEAWAWEALQRTRDGCAALGVMAGQVPLRRAA